MKERGFIALLCIAIAVGTITGLALREENPSRPIRAQGTNQSTKASGSVLQSLLDPAKTATLKNRAINSRLMKILAVLLDAQDAGDNPRDLLYSAMAQLNLQATSEGRMAAEAILENLKSVQAYGCGNFEARAAMRAGKSPAIEVGTSVGDILTVDHIIPIAAAPELENCFANLELLPLRKNQSKGDRIDQRQVDLARKLFQEGLISETLLRRIENARESAKVDLEGHFNGITLRQVALYHERNTRWTRSTT